MDRPSAEPAPANHLDPAASIEVLLAEYREMYRLVEFRMASLERRVPAAGAAIVAFLGVLPLMPESSQWILLVVIPASLMWFVRTTINHARSFEDVLRRIEWIERRANQLAGEDLLGFQSNHPSRGRAVGGRTGLETVGAVLLASALVLVTCLVLTTNMTNDGIVMGLVYYGYIVAIGTYLIACVHGWRRYQSKENPSGFGGIS